MPGKSVDEYRLKSLRDQAIIRVLPRRLDQPEEEEVLLGLSFVVLLLRKEKDSCNTYLDIICKHVLYELVEKQ